MNFEDRLPKFDGHRVSRQARHPSRTPIARIERLAAEIAPLVGADGEETKARGAAGEGGFADEVVGEFPELPARVNMGKYYALAQGEDASVAAASEERCKPQGHKEQRADRSGTCVDSSGAGGQDQHAGSGSREIDEKPTGSKDPYVAAESQALEVSQVGARRQNAPAVTLKCPC